MTKIIISHEFAVFLPGNKLYVSAFDIVYAHLFCQATNVTLFPTLEYLDRGKAGNGNKPASTDILCTYTVAG